MQGRGLKHGSPQSDIVKMRSPLVQGRGLKHYENLKERIVCQVAPRAGARIETAWHRPGFGLASSPLVQGRGLKLQVLDESYITLTSPLVQGRGLKLLGAFQHCRPQGVAPRAGARIETLQEVREIFGNGRPSCRGAD